MVTHSRGKVRGVRWKCYGCIDYPCRVLAAPWMGEPPKCVYWKDRCNWIRIDKHEQNNLDEYGSNDNERS